MTKQSLVEFKNVEKRFGDTIAVEAMDLDIRKGEFLAIMGSSGCGKTTTLRMLAGLEQPSAGEIFLDGKRVDNLRPEERDTPLVWQSLALFPFLSVVENVEFGLKMRGVERDERRTRALDWLARLGIQEFADRNVDQLSGGQRQRVALARALVTTPEILLLDEPLSALDANLVVRMQGVLSRLQKDLGITFVYVTHSQSEAFAMADRIVVMSNGRVEQIGTPEEIYRTPRSRFVAEFIGTNNIVEGSVVGMDGQSVTIQAQGLTFTAVVPDTDADIQQGQTVTAVISADSIDIGLANQAGDNSITGTLVSEAFVGSVVTLLIETSAGEFRVQTRQRDLPEVALEPGAELTITWSGQDVFLLPA